VGSEQIASKVWQLIFFESSLQNDNGVLLRTVVGEVDSS